MAFENLSFEDEDPVAAGFAEFWATTFTGSDFDAADFGTGASNPDAPLENFRGGWNNDSYVFSYEVPDNPSELEAAIFDDDIPETVENFEDEWDNTAYFFAMAVTSPASFDANITVTSAPGPWEVNLGDAFDFTTSLGSASSDVIAATAAELEAANLPTLPFDFDSEKIRLYVSEEVFGTITLTGTQTTTADVALAINLAMAAQGLSARCTASDSGGKLLIVHDVPGYLSEIRVQNVTHGDTCQRLGFDVTQIETGAFGTGNVALLDGATAEDLAALINETPALGTIGVGATVSIDNELVAWGPPGGTIMVDSSGALATSIQLFPLDDVLGPAGFDPEDFEDFEEAWDNEIIQDEGNLAPTLGAETWTPGEGGSVDTVDSQPGGLGNADATVLIDLTVAGGQEWFGDLVTYGGAETRARVWLRKDETAPNVAKVSVVFDAPGAPTASVYVDITTGRGVIGVDTQLREVTISAELIPGWYRVELYLTPGGISPLQFVIEAAAAAVVDWPVVTGEVGQAETSVTVWAPAMLESGTALEGYALSWGDVDAGIAIFDSADIEDFGSGWNNDAYQTTMGSTTAAAFDTGPAGANETVEDFEEVKAPFLVTPDATANDFNLNSHGLANGQRVQFKAENGALPAGLATGTDYYVVNTAANDFQVSVTSGGAAVDITDVGTGQLRVYPSPAVYWTEVMATL